MTTITGYCRRALPGELGYARAPWWDGNSIKANTYQELETMLEVIERQLARVHEMREELKCKP